jgi:N-acetylglucosaminyldiphosphoundecaprenol N-acetyl-beta-D-mannosaminyltransferase
MGGLDESRSVAGGDVRVIETDFAPDAPGRPPECAPRFDLFGVSISAVNIPRTIEIMESWISTGHRDYVILTGAHGVVEMQDDPELRAINNGSGLTTPDGMPVVWWGRAKGFPDIEKVYAPDIMTAMSERGAECGHRHYFYGGADGVADVVASELASRYPGLVVAGTFCPPFRALEKAEEEDIADTINRARPDVVWVGLGCPKQERWIARNRERLTAPVVIGVGAGFDFIAGTTRHAPRWIQRSGFEWLFRLLCEPRRLWSRYSRVVPRFLYLSARAVLAR